MVGWWHRASSQVLACKGVGVAANNGRRGPRPHPQKGSKPQLPYLDFANQAVSAHAIDTGVVESPLHTRLYPTGLKKRNRDPFSRNTPSPVRHDMTRPGKLNYQQPNQQTPPGLRRRGIGQPTPPTCYAVSPSQTIRQINPHPNHQPSLAPQLSPSPLIQIHSHLLNPPPTSP